MGIIVVKFSCKGVRALTDVKFCQNNYTQGVEEAVTKLESEGVNVKVESCLGKCDICSVEPFAIVDGEVITADSTNKLYEKIKSSF